MGKAAMPKAAEGQPALVPKHRAPIARLAPLQEPSRDRKSSPRHDPPSGRVGVRRPDPSCTG